MSGPEKAGAPFPPLIPLFECMHRGSRAGPACAARPGARHGVGACCWLFETRACYYTCYIIQIQLSSRAESSRVGRASVALQKRSRERETQTDANQPRSLRYHPRISLTSEVRHACMAGGVATKPTWMNYLASRQGLGFRV
jgi:hypothetical protein